jgi:hypothetical protein
MPITREETAFGISGSGESPVRVPGVPVFVINASGTITFSFSDSGNGETVTYAIYAEAGGVDRGYLKANGTDNGASEVWQTIAVWSNITATGLTDFTAYRFKVKAKSEAGTETAFSSYSAVMNTLPDVDYGPESDNLSREVSGGNTVIDTTLGIIPSGTLVSTLEQTQAIVAEYYGEILLTYTLKNNSLTDSCVSMEFSEDYNPNDPTAATWATATPGVAGDGLTGLTTSVAGVEHTISWDSYTDAGTSELKLGVYIRLTPYDASPSGGDAGIAIISSVFGINNLPAKITIENGDGYTYDKDTTPEFVGIIPNLRGGTKCFPYLYIYESTGTTTVQENRSVESIDGWWYETAPSTWVAMTVSGIPSSAIDGVNRLKYIVQTALPMGDYIIKGACGEYRNWS